VRERERGEGALCYPLSFLFIRKYIFVCFIKQACLLAAHAMWYIPMHIAELIACIILLHLKIFVCLLKPAHMLAIVSKFGGGGDASILWLSKRAELPLAFPRSKSLLVVSADDKSETARRIFSQSERRVPLQKIPSSSSELKS
jgi:hypothetical protein